MKLTEDKLRNIIQEELRFQQGRTSPAAGTANYHIHQFIKKVANVFASRLQESYEIQFEDAYEGNMSVRTDFSVYNNRQDIMKEGRFAVFDVGGKIKVELMGGRLGDNPSDMQTIINEDFEYNEAPLGEIDIVSAMQILAGR